MKRLRTRDGAFNTAVVVPVVLASALTILAACTPGSINPPGGPTARPLSGGCVLHADAFASDNIHLNVKVFTATRDDATRPHTANFGDFRAVLGPSGSPAGPFTNSDGIASTYALTEAWHRGSGFNEVYRAQVVPSTGPGNISTTGAALGFACQDFTGSWLTMPLTNSYFGTTLVGETDASNDDPLPQWLQVGVANTEMFACGGMLTENGRERTTWVMQVMPRGTTGASHRYVPIQDVLNGDRYFTPTPPDPLFPAVTVASPATGMGPPGGNGPTQGIVACAMTQTGDDSTTRRLHLLAVNGRQLLHATLFNYGTVFQPLSDGDTRRFSRFRGATPWTDVLQGFPGDFGDLVDMTVVASGFDQVVHVFFAGRRNEGAQFLTTRLWHAKWLGNGWAAPVDVFNANGTGSSGTPLEMRLAAAFCPYPDDKLWVRTGDQQILVAWMEPSTHRIFLMEVDRVAKAWVSGGPSSIYSPWRIVPNTGMVTTRSAGGTLTFTPFRVRVSTRPFSDAAGPP